MEHSPTQIGTGAGRASLAVPDAMAVRSRDLPTRQWLGHPHPPIVSVNLGGCKSTCEPGETRDPVSPNRLTQLVREYINALELDKSGACHLLRHTCATLMLEGGADIWFIQQLLGHAELSTTQIYTQVSIQQLKQVHSVTHPARLERPPKPSPGKAPPRP